MRRPAKILLPALGLVILCGAIRLALPPNLLEDPSFEITKPKDQFGLVFAKWGGWKYEGDCDFRVGQVARTGKHSCLLVGGAGAKIRIRQDLDLEPGRYKITAYLRGLDIGTGTWNMDTEFMFADKYLPLKKNGTFGWTRMTYVAEIKEKKKTGPSFGMWAPGYFWIEDVALVKVGENQPLTEVPVLDQEEAPIVPPGDIGTGSVRCPECGYKNLPQWGRCYACGTPLEAKKNIFEGPAVKTIATFEDRNPFAGGQVVAEHATDGTKALRLDKSYTVMDGRQDWGGYDFLKADLFAQAKAPLDLYVEIQDASTRDYWTRVNYSTVAPPGPSTLTIPIKQLYVGEKSRPGRMLLLREIKRLVFSIGDSPAGPLFLDNIRLERDNSADQVVFAGLHAFDFGLNTSPVLEGFSAITPGTLYSKGRGYGLKNARIWRAFDALQPDPLYQDFICLESGGLAVDLPNGHYRVWVNMDSPSGFWGEYQNFRQRKILAEGKAVLTEHMNLESFRKKYYRFWDVEDLPTENTFDKYQKPYFQEKTFDVEVKDGQLNVDFQGENWACSVSAVVIFPVEKAADGEKFLKYVEQKRRFYFDNYFKRVLHQPTGDLLQPSAEDRRRGFVAFTRDYMKDVFYNDTPFKEEIGKPVAGEAFAGEYEPLTVSLVPLANLGKVALAVTGLAGPGGTIPASAVEVGFVSYRISRLTSEGSVYTINPRLIMPSNAAAMPQGITRRFWLTVKTPKDAKPGLYKGEILVQAEGRNQVHIPVAFRVRQGVLDSVDIPAGPFGYTIGLPWYGDDPGAAAFNQDMALKSLRKMREYGFTTFSGIPHIVFQGCKDGKPLLDFRHADSLMKIAKELGFLAVVSYGGGVSGFDAYFKDLGQMQAAGFTDYSAFIQAVYSEVQKHADQQGWIPVYFNLADEPIGEAAVRSAENAEAYRQAFPKGPPFFTGATSFEGTNDKDPHFRLSKAFHAPSWNGHDEAAVNLIHAAGGEWAFYNGGNRWTFGDYMYKGAKKFGMRFRVSWHWNVVAGDPYYALDCREDDYAWCNSSPTGKLIPAIEFERLREGLDDYRRLATLARLAKIMAGTYPARAGEKLLESRLAGFKLGQRDHDALFGLEDWSRFRRQVDDAIEALRE